MIEIKIERQIDRRTENRKTERQKDRKTDNFFLNYGRIMAEPCTKGYDTDTNQCSASQSQLCEKSIFQTDHTTATKLKFVAATCRNGTNLCKK